MIIMPVFRHGGAETQFRLLAVGLSKLMKVSLWSFQQLDPDDIEMLKKNNIEYRITCLNFWLIRNEVTKLLRYFFYCIKLSYEFIFFHYTQPCNKRLFIFQGFTMSLFIPLFKMLGAKVLFSSRTATPVLLEKKYLAWFYNSAHAISTNALLTNQYLTTIGVKKSKIWYIPNGIEIEREPSWQLPRPLKKLYVIARIHPFKNQMYVLESLKNTTQYEIVLVGRQQHVRYYHELKQFVKLNQMSGRVSFIDFTKNIHNLYEDADVVVLPSLEEGCANVILESFKYGKICIASDIPTNRDLLENRGFLIDLNKSGDLTETLTRIELTSEKELLQMLRSNFQYAKEKFRIENNLKNYFQLINSLFT